MTLRSRIAGILQRLGPPIDMSDYELITEPSIKPHGTFGRFRPYWIKRGLPRIDPHRPKAPEASDRP